MSHYSSSHDSYGSHSGQTASSPYSRSSQGSGGSKRHRSRRHSRRKFIIAGTAVGVVAIVGVAGGYLAHTGLNLVDTAKAQANDLSATADRLMAALKSADFTAANSESHTLVSQIDLLNSTLDDRLVTVAENMTSYGSDIRTARMLLSSLKDVVCDALIPLTDTLSQFGVDSLLQSDGEGLLINMESLQNIISAVVAAIPPLRTCLSSIAQMKGDLQLEQLSSIISTAQTMNESYGALFDTAERLLPLVPDLLGANGPRTYLMIAQTNSEIAATGGFPGSMGYATMDNGRFTMGDFSSVFQVIPRLAQPLSITDEEMSLFGDGITFATDTFGHNPDFPRAAEMWAQANEQANGFSIDGVVTLDPMFLQSMLALTGAGIPMSDGSYIDGTNAAQTLLNSVYWNYIYDSSLQDAYFSEAASSAADAIMGALPSLDTQQLLELLTQAFGERRLNLWLANPAEEEALRELGLDNGVDGPARAAQLGIFLNDAIWSKMEWYLRMRVELGEETEMDGARCVPTAVTLTNTITYEEAWAANGNAYIVGYNEDVKREDGDMGVQFFLYAPAGGNIVNFSCEESPSGYTSEVGAATHKGRVVITGLAKMLPGESLTLRFDTVLPTGVDGPLEVDTTPLGQPTEVIRM